MAAVSVLANFANPNGNTVSIGYGREDNLTVDNNGDLFGTTEDGGASGDGTAFEILKTPTGYASTPTTLVSFDGADGMDPESGLFADANGDLFGTTSSGGLHGDGTVFEIVKTSTGYASAPTTLVNFSGSDGVGPTASLIADANGDLFGTTEAGGASGDGTAFEILKTPTGYASTPTTLVSFNSSGGSPSGLIANANGDLFGTTYGGDEGADPGYYGTVFEIVKTSSGYTSAATTLASFDVTYGGDPNGVVADADGNLFGTTYGGTVFELQNNGTATAPSYASAPTILVSFDGSDGELPVANLIADANGDLFGTAADGGAYFDGTVFELAKTSTGYASAPTTLVNFGGANGAYPQSRLIADANGDLFGTTSGGGLNGGGTVFEVTGRGPASPPGPPNFFNSDDEAGILWRNTNGDTELWNPNGSGGFTYQNLGVVNTSWQIAGTGDFNGAGKAGILWRNTNGSVELWNSNGSGGFTYDNLGVVNTTWQIAGTGDFNGDGEDILWRNANGDTELWNANGLGGFTYQNLGVVNTSWQIVGTGHLTGGGEDSILWQNSNGDTELWYPNGQGGFGYQELTSFGIGGSSSQIAGWGDFGFSGDSILTRATDGDIELWDPLNPGYTQDSTVVNPNLQIVGTGDYTGSGESFLSRTANGDTELWHPNGSGGFTSRDLGIVNTSWSVQKIFV